jgi:hypothetical protein
MASCCNGRRVNLSGGGAGINPSRGIAGYVSRYGQDDLAPTSPALGAGNFGKMVGAGVTIWAITRVLDRVMSGRRK